MRIRTLGRSGLRVSELCLGAMTFGMPEWGCDEPESRAIIDRFLDAGGNFIDTADAYSGTISEEICGRAREEGIGLITWSPLAAGMLTGKITRDRKPPESRLAQRDMPLYRLYFNERSFGIVDVLVGAAKEAGCPPAQLALAWQLAKPEITSVIIGARNLAQLEDNLGAT